MGRMNSDCWYVLQEFEFLWGLTAELNLVLIFGVERYVVGWGNLRDDWKEG